MENKSYEYKSTDYDDYKNYLKYSTNGNTLVLSDKDSVARIKRKYARTWPIILCYIYYYTIFYFYQLTIISQTTSYSEVCRWMEMERGLIESKLFSLKRIYSNYNINRVSIFNIRLIYETIDYCKNYHKDRQQIQTHNYEYGDNCHQNQILICNREQ